MMLLLTVLFLTGVALPATKLRALTPTHHKASSTLWI